MPTEHFTVIGKVYYADGKPFVRGLVRAYDRDMRSKELLFETTTSTKGLYKGKYTADQFRRAEKRTADLVVEVSKGNETAQSAILYNAPVEATVDLEVQAQPQPRLSLRGRHFNQPHKRARYGRHRRRRRRHPALRVGSTGYGQLCPPRRRLRRHAR